ncbi:MAG: hypothetical protein ABL928_01385 [Sphingorhabdus sp.]
MKGFPEFEQFCIVGFPASTQDWSKSVASTDFATSAFPKPPIEGRSFLAKRDNGQLSLRDDVFFNGLGGALRTFTAAAPIDVQCTVHPQMAFCRHCENSKMCKTCVSFLEVSFLLKLLILCSFSDFLR